MFYFRPFAQNCCAVCFSIRRGNFTCASWPAYHFCPAHRAAGIGETDHGRIVTSRSTGHRHFYRANRKHPMFADLQRLVLKGLRHGLLSVKGSGHDSPGEGQIGDDAVHSLLEHRNANRQSNY